MRGEHAQGSWLERVAEMRLEPSDTVSGGRGVSPVCEGWSRDTMDEGRRKMVPREVGR